MANENFSTKAKKNQTQPQSTGMPNPASYPWSAVNSAVNSAVKPVTTLTGNLGMAALKAATPVDEWKSVWDTAQRLQSQGKNPYTSGQYWKSSANAIGNTAALPLWYLRSGLTAAKGATAAADAGLLKNAASVIKSPVSSITNIIKTPLSEAFKMPGKFVSSLFAGDTASNLYNTYQKPATVTPPTSQTLINTNSSINPSGNQVVNPSHMSSSTVASAQAAVDAAKTKAEKDKAIATLKKAMQLDVFQKAQLKASSSQIANQQSQSNKASKANIQQAYLSQGNKVQAHLQGLLGGIQDNTGSLVDVGQGKSPAQMAGATDAARNVFNSNISQTLADTSGSVAQQLYNMGQTNVAAANANAQNQINKLQMQQGNVAQQLTPENRQYFDSLFK